MNTPDQVATEAQVQSPNGDQAKVEVRQPDKDNKVTVNCKGCRQVFQVKLPYQERVNTIRSSLVIAHHENPVKCPYTNCGLTMIFRIANADILWDLAPVSEEFAEKIKPKKSLIQRATLIPPNLSIKNLKG